MADFCFQIETSGRCDFDDEVININETLLDVSSDIILGRQGACLSLYGSGTLETYREILLSARYGGSVASTPGPFQAFNEIIHGYQHTTLH